MQWTREYIAKDPSLRTFETHISTIENNVEINPSLCVEVSKSLTEALCKTILTNQNTTYKDDISFNSLVKQTLEHLIKQTGKEIVGLSELCRRISAVAQSIAEIRNNAGFASHGLDVLHPQIDKSLSLLIYKTADVLCGFILHFYFSYAHHANQRLIYQDCECFNDWFDEENPLEVGGVHLSASEALYNLDYQAYKANYIDYLEFLLEMNEQ